MIGLLLKNSSYRQLTPDNVYENFLAYKPGKKMTQAEIKQTYGLCAETVRYWRKFVIDRYINENPESLLAMRLKSAFYYSQKCSQGVKIRRASAYQVFIYWLIWILRSHLKIDFDQTAEMLAELVRLLPSKTFQEKFNYYYQGENSG
ncbi:MAG: hypothetical protein F6K26_03420 [Moorea sp. SIO2I5]|nr:hypothetical protein [Moorena sp. SIO2I5]